MAYRSDVDALVAQCDALKRELARAEKAGQEVERLRGELERCTRELVRLRAEIDPAAAPRRRVRWAALALVASAGTGAWVWLAMRPAPPAPVRSARAWFEAARPHCNPLEARDHLSRSRPPVDPQAAGFLATCWALAGEIEEARRNIAGAGPHRALALQTLFDFAHPIADRGDDRSAGPIMSLIAEEWPTNFMALYHAGMSDYAAGQATRARDRLTRFLGLYHQPDGWTANAKRALEGLASGRGFVEVFGGGRDPRIE